MLVQRGHKVHVLCAAKADAKSEMAVEGVSVYRVADWLINASGRVAPSHTSQGTVKSDGWRAAWRLLLRKCARTIWRGLHWPDYACGWIFPASAKARKLYQENQYDWVVSVSHPFSGHMVGWLMRKHMIGARWFLDIGDPFSLMDEPAPNNSRIYLALNRWMEAKVLDRADAISVTTESTQKVYEAEFPRARGKVYLIPPLLSLPDIAPPSQRVTGETLRLVYVGTLYRKLRSPNFLLACLAAFKSASQEAKIDHRVELHFYGALNDCVADLAACPQEIRDAVIVHGMVGRAEALQAMIDADILVNIGNDSETQLASKVIEYMAVGKPILNLVSHPGDRAVAALMDYPSALTLVRDEGVTSVTVAALFKFLLAPPVVPASVAVAARERYSVARITNDYEAVLNSVDAKHGQ